MCCPIDHEGICICSAIVVISWAAEISPCQFPEQLKQEEKDNQHNVNYTHVSIGILAKTLIAIKAKDWRASILILELLGNVKFPRNIWGDIIHEVAIGTIQWSM